MAKKEVSQLDEVLGTSDQAKQVELVKQLKMAANAPFACLTITFDPRNGEVSIYGSQMPNKIAQQLLDAAKTRLIQADVREAMQREKAQQEPQKKAEA